MVKKYLKKKKIMKKKAPKNTISRIVKKELRKDLEVKHRLIEYSGQVIARASNSIEIAGLNVGTYPIAPCSAQLPIAQGVTDSARVGNEIRIKRARMKMILYTVPWDNVVNTKATQKIVGMYIYETVERPTEPPTSTLFSGQFFENNGGNSGFSVDTTDLCKYVNPHRVKLKYFKFFKVGPAFPTGTTLPSVANNDFKSVHSFYLDYTKYLRKVYTYNDTTTQPSQPQLFCTMVFWNADSSTIETADAFTISANISWRIDYTDA